MNTQEVTNVTRRESHFQLLKGDNIVTLAILNKYHLRARCQTNNSASIILLNIHNKTYEVSNNMCFFVCLMWFFSYQEAKAETVKDVVNSKTTEKNKYVLVVCTD